MPVALAVVAGLLLLGCCTSGVVAAAVMRNDPKPSTQVFGTAPTAQTAPATPASSPAGNLAAALVIVNGTRAHLAASWAAGQATYGTADFPAWYRNATADQQCEADQAKAGRLIPDDANSAYVRWFEDCVEVEAHVSLWANAASQQAGRGGGTSATMTAEAAKVNQALAAVDADVAALAKA